MSPPEIQRGKTLVGDRDTIMYDKLWRALVAIDACLTTAEGDNVPRGEACKIQARFLAREALERNP